MIEIKSNITIHLRSLQQQIIDAFQDGKLDSVTYNSMLIEMNAINNICDMELMQKKPD